MPGGQKIAFPASMQDSEINNVLSNWIPGSGMATNPTAPQPSVNMQTVATPKSVGTSFGQGLLDVPRGLTHALDTWMEPEKNIGEPQSQYWQQTKQQFGQGNPAWVANLINAVLAPTGLPQQTQAFAQGAMQDPVRAMGQGAGMYLAGKVPGMTEGGPSTADLKTGVADAAYKRGLGVAENLKAASSQIDDAVAQSAQRFISKVDEKFPNGAIDPKPITDAVTQLKADIVKTPERYPPALAQLLEPPAKTSTGLRIMGGHLDLSDPAQLASYQKMKAQGAFTPQEIARMEGGGTEGMWSADEAKQWRTKIGQAIGKVQGPMKSVMTEAYDNLTQQLRRAADDSDALKDFQDYNNLHKKHMAFLNDPVVSKIMDGTTSRETLGPLADPEKQAHLQNLLADWDKYGIRTEDLQKEGTDYGKAQAILAKQGFRWWPWGTLGGMAGGRILGIGYPAGAVAGLAAEKLFGPAGKAARLIESSRTSPFYEAGAAKAADIARGWSEGLPDISSRKIALKRTEGK